MTNLQLLLRGIFLLGFTYLYLPFNYAQDLLTSNNKSPIVLIYRLKPQEVQRIHKKGPYEIDSTFFHSLQHWYHRDSLSPTLEIGNFLKVSVEKGDLKYELLEYRNVQIEFVGNDLHQGFLVLNEKGELIEDAKVFYRKNRIPFNKKSGTYKVQNLAKKGVIEVVFKNHSSFFEIDRSFNGTLTNRVSRKVIYSFPVKYLWTPFRDIYKTIAQGYPYGFINRASNIFRERYRDYSYKYPGFISFSQPKYRPGDTVKLKAFITTRKGRPLQRELELRIGDYGGSKVLKDLKPYRKGGYEYAFVLDDSLDLKLDKYVFVSLGKNNKKKFLRRSFDYEDYELKSFEFTMRVAQTNLSPGSPLEVYFRGTDANGLNLLDATVEFTLVAERISAFESMVVVPDTLFTKKVPLEATGESKLIIPSEHFPNAQISYKLIANMTTSDQESRSKTLSGTFHPSKRQINFDLEADSLNIEFRESHKTMPIEAQLISFTSFLDTLEVKAANLPLRILPAGNVYRYTVIVEDLIESFELSKNPSGIQVSHHRSADSVFISTKNPRKVPIWYHLYHKNKLIYSGSETTFDFKEKSRSKGTYSIQYAHLWAGKVHKESQEIPFYKDLLNLKIDQPDDVFPGQEIDVEITVTDQQNSPVKEADLTAFAYTSKFKSSSSDEVPYLGTMPKGKRSYQSYRNPKKKITLNKSLKSKNLLFSKFGLDSMEYYRFRFPGNQLYTSYSQSPDSLTQFAPFYFHNESPETVHVIYLNERPIYFSGVTVNQPYSFKVDSGQSYTIKLRTRYRLITLKGIRFKNGVKTFLSLSNKTSGPNVEFRSMPTSFTDNEKRNLSRYLAYIENTFEDSWVILEQGDRIQLIEPSENKWRRKNKFLVGPFENKNLKVTALDQFELDAIFIPRMSIQYFPELIRERETPIAELSRRFTWGAIESLTDFVIYPKTIKREWEDLKRSENIQQKLLNPGETRPGQGRMIIRLPDSLDSAPSFHLVSRYENPNFLRVYYKTHEEIHDLHEGFYRVVAINQNRILAEADSIKVEPNSTTLVQLKRTQNDSYFQEDVFGLIENSYALNDGTVSSGPNRIREAFQQRYQPSFSGFGRNISGRITDNSGEGLPGVTVLIKGTSIGTISDLDGYYSISVPSNAVLVYSFIGMKSEEIEIGNRSIIDTTLESDVQHLDEVIVVGYGVTHRKAMTASISTLQGQVAGVSISGARANPGSAQEMKIRGALSVGPNDKPLVIIDGIPLSEEQMKDLDINALGSIEIIKDQSITALYGSKAAGGVIMISSKSIGPALKKTLGIPLTGEVQSTENSLRSNFSDNAWWQPNLQTDQNGKASFKVTMPDDVTGWDTYVKAVTHKRQSGEWQGFVKSYKQLLATLSTPGFLVRGDTSYAIGKLLNYTSDTLLAKTTIIQNEKNNEKPYRAVITSVIDSVQLVAQAFDSVSTTYRMTLENGYSDGELRHVPVFEPGLEESSGDFHYLDRDTTLVITMNKESGPMNVSIFSSMTDILFEEIESLIQYPYECNEQLASKLIALLVKKQLYDSLGKSFSQDGKVKSIIRKLEKNQSDDGSWSWWTNRGGSIWITDHVITALTLAIESGYSAKFKTNDLTGLLIWKYPTYDFQNKLQALRLLQKLGYTESEDKILELETEAKRTEDFIAIQHLRYLAQMPTNVDSLIALRRSTVFGNSFWDYDSSSVNIHETTLLAYQILKGSNQSDNELRRIRMSLAESRKKRFWLNTYQSSQILMTLRNDLWKEKVADNEVLINDQKLDKLPFSKAMDSVATIKKSGTRPVFVSVWQKSWNEKPRKREDFGTVETSLDNGQVMEAGKPVKLKVSLKTDQECEYVMMEVPIPAGCSYQTKKVNYGREEHREYYKEKVNIYCQKLSSGTHSFEIDLLPRFSGTYTLNPSKVELMYAPNFQNSNEIKRVQVK